MNNEEKKITYDKKKILIVGVGLLLIILIICLIIFLPKDKKEEPKEEPKQEEKYDENGNAQNVKEENIIETYQMTKEEAIELVKKQVSGESYEFNCTVETDGTYKVTVTNTITKNTFVYKVYPDTKRVENQVK